MPRYYCLIADISGKCILALPDGAGRWTLPAFDDERDWFAWAAPALARKASQHFGVHMTALREHGAGDWRVCELEIQAPQWTPPAGTRWIARGDQAALEPDALTAILQAWFVEQQSGAVPKLRPPWEKRGWFTEASDWIATECARLDYAPSGPVEQVKAAWSVSCILRVNISGGTLYFKADIAKPPFEPAIIKALARRWPRNVPDIAAVDDKRGWMLMRDFGQRRMENEPFSRWLDANRTFSKIQIACGENLEPWQGLGCPDFRIPALAAHMDRMLADPAALRIGEPGGLSEAEAARLQALTPQIHEMWNALAAIPIPSSMVQQDFRLDNVVMSGEDFLFHDWSDTAIGHPFFSCCRFLDYLHHAPNPDGVPLEERKQQITEAYLAPWKELLGDADISRAFELARTLNPIYVAIRRYLDAPYCEPGSSWGRALREGPAIELRRFLAGK